MLSEQQLTQFAREWIAGWNSHNLELILSHYADEIEFISPLIVKLSVQPDGLIKGKENLRNYFTKGLATYPELKFELLQILFGVNSITIFYRSVNNLLAAELMVLNNEMKAMEVRAHYHPYLTE
ncbi:MAG TPA: nuclear transport factor 2 family protein [Cyanobacteria bacterium UBA11149]|nr:nuclear transport factor 2 family protein [Cyanobacteria bacterium UBA11367]HBE60189.1 nuclear transport factor 2 family protein [Cyanobacteria bacterium UBA11366]HBK64069.1 nuclear transport factor 2 family protein [Cyanobacteria bacterium UBA11166]HBR75560.1 nuclear transport factor 2 family protein [Cyanobacteria bacterium UBA11159]HBS72407.1 nuclear transport factor 2 family protein [Cyanobacteria bacterium UBA11153]HBW89852.1 nuclear transport factor 2 family protein [Cyanobacteria bac